jgi:hypothetical protein
LYYDAGLGFTNPIFGKAPSRPQVHRVAFRLGLTARPAPIPTFSPAPIPRAAP